MKHVTVSLFFFGLFLFGGTSLAGECTLGVSAPAKALAGKPFTYKIIGTPTKVTWKLNGVAKPKSLMLGADSHTATATKTGKGLGQTGKLVLSAKNGDGTSCSARTTIQIFPQLFTVQLLKGGQLITVTKDGKTYFKKHHGLGSTCFDLSGCATSAGVGSQVNLGDDGIFTVTVAKKYWYIPVVADSTGVVTIPATNAWTFIYNDGTSQMFGLGDIVGLTGLPARFTATGDAVYSVTGSTAFPTPSPTPTPVPGPTNTSVSYIGGVLSIQLGLDTNGKIAGVIDPISPNEIAVIGFSDYENGKEYTTNCSGATCLNATSWSNVPAGIMVDPWLKTTDERKVWGRDDCLGWTLGTGVTKTEHELLLN